jgi:hypothetical protein
VVWGRDDLVPDYIDYAILHGLVHSLGFAASTAPHQHSTGHVYDVGAPDPSRDLMYSPRPGMPDQPWGVGRGLLLDLGSDDYYGAGAGPDLATSSLLSPLPDGAQRPVGW